MKEGNRFTFHIKMFILLIILLLFSFSVLATCPEVQEDCVKEEEFNKNPTAENLQKIDEPTVDQFIKLKPGEKIKYLDQNYREDLAENYYQSNGPGANHEVDKKFFEQIEFNWG